MNILMLLLASALAFGTTGCKKKKIADAQRIEAEERAQRIARAKEILLSILNDDGSMSLEEKERQLNNVKAMNIDDAEIQDLIAQVEAKLAKEREEAEASKAASAEKASYTKLGNYFSSISNAPSVTAANRSIEEALGMFANDEVPVLIVIYQSGNQKDYDRPTTIREYLNYLKDQRKNPNKIQNIVTNNQGKITEIELVK
jgi:hypothetical protein